MKKYILLTFIGLATVISTRAQEFKVNKSSGKLIVKLSSATIEGYNGTEVIFKSERKQEDEDPRAKGLRAINGAGNTDNTGLGISVVEKGNTVEVQQVAGDIALKIMVPKGMSVSFICHKLENAGKVILKNIDSEIELATDYNSVELDNISGPVSATSLYGSIEAKFGDRVKGPISIASIYSTVDVAIPVSTAANVKLSSTYGSILASADLKIAIEKKAGEDDMVAYGGNKVDGKLNGGGLEFKLTAEYGKIYLRKTK
jgi:hypothetical protein